MDPGEAGLGEVAADVEEPRASRSRGGVGEAIAEVQGGGVPPLAVLLEGLMREPRLGGIEGKDKSVDLAQKRFQLCGRLRAIPAFDHKQGLGEVRGGNERLRARADFVK